MDGRFGNIFSTFSRFIRDERPYHSTHNHPTCRSCSQNVKDEFLNGAILGGIWSGSTSMMWVRRRQIRFPRSMGEVMLAAVGGGLSFGVPLAAWQRAVCSTMQVREVDDLINPWIAGGFVGAMSEIPVYVRGKLYLAMKANGYLADPELAHLRTRPLFFVKSVLGASMGLLYYMLLRDIELATSQDSPQPPQAPTHGKQNGEAELDTLNSSEIQEDNSDWVIAETLSGEFLESDDLSWVIASKLKPVMQKKIQQSK